MARIYSDNFSAGLFTAGGTSPMFTVPAGYVYVVREMDINIQGVLSECNFSFEWATAADPTDFLPFWPGHLAAVGGDNFLQWKGRAVFPEGDVVQCTVGDLTGSCISFASGYRLGP